jgi:hypothetical protein
MMRYRRMENGGTEARMDPALVTDHFTRRAEGEFN